MDEEQGRSRLGFSVSPATVDAVINDGTTVTLTGLTEITDAAGTSFVVGTSSRGRVAFSALNGDTVTYLSQSGVFTSRNGDPTIWSLDARVVADGIATQRNVIGWLENQGQPVNIP